MKTKRVRPDQRILLIIMTWLFVTDFVFSQESVDRLRGLRAKQPNLEEIEELVGPPAAPPAAARPAMPGAPGAGGSGEAAVDPETGEPMIRLTYIQATLDIVLADYSEHTGRTLLLAPGVTTQPITLQSEGALSLSKWLNAVETILNMYGVALLEEGDQFTRVVPNKQARTEPMEILAYDDDLVVEDSGELISQMIALTHIEVTEAIGAIKTVHHPYATVTAFESINSLLITDTSASINRVLRILEYIDVPIEAREEPFVVQILYAKASEIKGKLEQIIAETQKDQKKSTIPRARESGAPGVVTRPRTPSGVIRARRAVPAAAVAANVLADVERGLVRGEVKIIDDERTNLLIIITRPENIPFFEKIIKVLDVETQPDVMVRVFRLEYAEAKDVGGMLNDLIGATKSEDVSAPAPDAAPAAGSGGTTLRDYVARRETAQPAAGAATGSGTAQAKRGAKSKMGELSQDNIKILSDERTNALIIMASRSDLAAMEEIIKNMDTMLLQVLIEVVILEINLDDSLQTGMDWIQRALITYEDRADGLRSPKVAYAGSGGGGDARPVDPLTLVSPTAFGTAAGLSYYLTLFDLNMDVVFQAVASDSRTRILSSPVIMTTDNKKATIDITQDQYVFAGQIPVQVGSLIEYRDDIQLRPIGIKLTVTPRINEKKFVVMEIAQSIENVAGNQPIGENNWPIVATRSMEAEIAVLSGETIVLGGLVREQDQRSRSKVPILGDIPLLGIPFRGEHKSEKQNEVIVLVTPYVMETPSDSMKDALRRKESMPTKGMWSRGWSNSKLADPMQVKPTESELEPAEAEEKIEAPARIIRPRSHSRGIMRAPRSKAKPVPVAAVEAITPVAVVAEPAESMEPVEPEPEVESEAINPLDALDPEVRKLIKAEDKRWGRKIRKADKKILKEYGLD